MSSSSRTVMLMTLLALSPGSELLDPIINDTHFGNKLYSDHTITSVTQAMTELRPETRSHGKSKIADKGSSLYHVLKYGDSKDTQPTDLENARSTSKSGARFKQNPRTRNINISYFDRANFIAESTNNYLNSEEQNSFGEQPYQPGGTENSKLIPQNVHHGHQECHVLENNHLASGLSQATDVKSVRRSSVMMNLPCCKIGNSTADCTGCGLTCVPTDLPRNITRLLLTDNYISSDDLYAGVFVNYTQLVELWLDSNNITSLPEGVFEGLEHLQFLSLYNNKIMLNMELNNSTVFYPLNNTLETLILNRNTQATNKGSFVYPDMALSVLKNLSRLHIDGLMHPYFGIGFSNLTKLTHLLLAGYHDGYCNISSISNDTFRYLPHLTSLNISDCFLNGSLIESNAFSNLFELQILDMSYNFDLGIHAVGKFMYGLRRNKNFAHLKIQRIVNRFTPCVVIYRHTLRHFRHTGLRIIEAMNNEIEMIELEAFDMLPSTLEILNLTDNRIMFGAYWTDMASLRGLKELYLDGYFIPVKFPDFFPSKDLQCPESRTQNYIDNLRVTRKYGVEKCLCGPGMCSIFANDIILPLPPQLQVFSMHSKSLAYTVNGIQFCSENNLTSVDLSDNTFKHLDGTVTGLNHIKNLNLSSCFIETIGDYFLDNLSSLEHLNLYQNLLGDCLNNDTSGNIFDKLTNLKYLNLSFNNIYKLKELMFKDLESINTLDLSVNRISHVNFSIKHMEQLQSIDLHKNDITTLPIDFLDALDNLLKRNKSVAIDMRDNPINCDCPNLEFLEWVISRKVFAGNTSNYFCKYQEGSAAATPMDNGYEDEVKRLRRECSTHVRLFVGVVGGTLLVVFVIIGLLLYRFRWTLRYWYHAAKMKIYSKPHQVSEEYEYDVFVSYASEDVDFVLKELSPHLSGERHIKLMIHGEKFQAGRHITDNIYMAVRQCRKTLVLVTRQMLASHWCGYELQMARMESISTGRDVLVFLFLEEIPTNLMNVDVMSYIKTSTYIFYPTDVEHREAFWNKLADDLRGR